MFRRQKKVDDETLVAWILEGDSRLDDATKQLIYDNGSKVKAYLLKLSNRREESEDAFYEGLAALILNVRNGSYKGQSSLSTYLTSICKGIWFKKYKRMMVHQKWEASEMAKPQTTYTETVLTQEVKNNLDFLLTTLKDKCREVLNLWAYSYSMTEIAQKLSYSNPQVVMNKKNLCLKELKKMLSDNPGLAELIE